MDEAVIIATGGPMKETVGGGTVSEGGALQLRVFNNWTTRFKFLEFVCGKRVGPEE